MFASSSMSGALELVTVISSNREAGNTGLSVRGFPPANIYSEVQHNRAGAASLGLLFVQLARKDVIILLLKKERVSASQITD